MKQFIRLTIALIVGIIGFGLQSCGNSINRRESTDFSFGMTTTKVDSLSTILGLTRLSENGNSISYTGDLSFLGQSWNIIALGFENNAMNMMMYSNTSIKDDELIQKYEDVSSKIYSLNPLPTQIVSGDYPQPRFGAWKNDNIIIVINAEQTPLSVSIVPYSALMEDKIIKKATSDKIDRTLSKLANSMAAWINATNQTIKDSYAEDVISCNRYLEEHYSDMDDRQKELFQRLKSVEAK